MKRLNLLVIGTGMYVCGRGTDGYGTILPAVFEWKRDGAAGDVYIAGNTREGIDQARRKASGLSRFTGLDVKVRMLPQGILNDPAVFKRAVSAISKPAACIVSVPDHLHKRMAGLAISSGLHTLIVKPLTPTVNEARELMALQKRRGVYCAVEFHKRYDLANVGIRDRIRQGAIGDILYFAVEYSQRSSVPLKHFKKWAERTNVFQYLGVHYVDIIYFATGALPKRAMATGQKGLLASKGLDVHDAIEAVVEWQLPLGNSFTSVIITNWIDPDNTSAMSDQKIKVIGTRGRIESDQKDRGLTVVTDAFGIEVPNPYFCRSYGRGGSAVYKGYGIESIKQFLGDVAAVERRDVSIDELEEDRSTFRQAIVSTAVVEAVNKSLAGGARWIKVEGVKL